MSPPQNTITDGQKAQIVMVLWMLKREVLKIQGLRQATENADRRQGQQDAIDMIEETILQGLSINDADIERMANEIEARRKAQRS